MTISHNTEELEEQLIKIGGIRYICPECEDSGVVNGRQKHFLLSGKLKCGVCAGDTGKDVFVKKICNKCKKTNPRIGNSVYGNNLCEDCHYELVYETKALLNE